jgi:DNA repair exonuclease SbcCD ATPase subunit
VRGRLQEERDLLISSTTENHHIELAEIREELGKAKLRINELEPLDSRVRELEAQLRKTGDDAKRVQQIEQELEEERSKRQEGEKEHEDLLVLLDELSSKRRKDKVRMKEKGLEVSDGEDEDGDAADEEEE